MIDQLEHKWASENNPHAVNIEDWMNKWDTHVHLLQSTSSATVRTATRRLWLIVISSESSDANPSLHRYRSPSDKQSSPKKLSKIIFRCLFLRFSVSYINEMCWTRITVNTE